MTIATTSSATPSLGRWSETPRLRPNEQARQSNAIDAPAKTKVEHEGPRRSPLFHAIKEALDAVVALAALSLLPASL